MKTQKAVALAVFLTLGILFLVVAGLFLLTGTIIRTDVHTGDRIAVIEVYGPIVHTGSIDFFGGRRATAEELTELIRKVNKNSKYKALVLKIDTPGGSAAGSQSIYRELMRLKEESGKPIIASFGDTATSGGYYIASAADFIIANPASLTGSIGVIIEIGNYEGLYEILGIEFEVIAGGEFKDIGHHSRALTKEERLILQGLTDEIYQQFISAVAQGRGIEETTIKELATGEIFSGSQALELNLVDQLGNYHDAIALATNLAGLKDPVIENLSRDRYGFLFSFLGILTNNISQNSLLSFLQTLVPKDAIRILYLP